MRSILADLSRLILILLLLPIIIIVIGPLLVLVVFRGDELITLSIKLADAPESTCYLELDSDAAAESLARQAAWLLTAQ